MQTRSHEWLFLPLHGRSYELRDEESLQVALFRAAEPAMPEGAILEWSAGAWMPVSAVLVELRTWKENNSDLSPVQSLVFHCRSWLSDMAAQKNISGAL